MTVTYTTTDGKKLTAEDIEQAKIGEIDYLISDKHFAAAEYNGKRSGFLFGGRAMEDAIAFGSIDGFSQLSTTQRIDALKKTIADVQVNEGNQQRIGSTMIAVAIVKSDNNKFDIYTSCLGDSLAFVSIFDKNGKVTEFRRLNTLLHNPENEVDRIRKFDPEFSAEADSFNVPRLRVGLAVSRALGDIVAEPCGLSHEPDIYHDEIIVPENGDIKLLLSCDGLTERDCLTEADLQRIIQDQYQAKSANVELAKLLAETAITEGSTDNVSTMVIDPSNECFYAVFDGHGGREVSEAAAEKVISYLKSHI